MHAYLEYEKNQILEEKGEKQHFRGYVQCFCDAEWDKLKSKYDYNTLYPPLTEPIQVLDREITLGGMEPLPICNDYLSSYY